MDFVIIGILLVIGILFVAYPIFRPPSIKNKKETMKQIRVEQSAIHLILEELEMDREMGHISEEEYRGLDARYRAELN
jgi:hypothetical protein